MSLAGNCYVSQHKAQMLNLFSTLANLATAIAVIVAAWQLWLSQKQARTTFEDSLAREYRDLASRLPTEAFLGETLADNAYTKYFHAFYRYLNLCNEQIFLKRAGRISTKTWEFWQEGIESNLRRPAFSRAWSEVAARSDGDFSELRSLFPPQPFNTQGAGDASPNI